MSSFSVGLSDLVLFWFASLAGCPSITRSQRGRVSGVFIFLDYVCSTSVLDFSVSLSSVSLCGILVLAIHMCVSVRVEGELLEVSGDKGAVFPFRVAEVSKRRVFVINLQLDEFRWLAREMARFCSSKGEPLWVRTFRGRNHCLLLQLTRNKKGRYIVFSQLSYSGKPRTIIFSEGPKADSWFEVTKLLKETLIGANSSAFAKSKDASKAARGFTSKPMPYANVVRGATSAVLSGN